MRWLWTLADLSEATRILKKLQSTTKKNSLTVDRLLKYEQYQSIASVILVEILSIKYNTSTSNWPNDGLRHAWLGNGPWRIFKSRSQVRNKSQVHFRCWEMHRKAKVYFVSHTNLIFLFQCKEGSITVPYLWLPSLDVPYLILFTVCIRPFPRRGNMIGWSVGSGHVTYSCEEVCTPCLVLCLSSLRILVNPENGSGR